MSLITERRAQFENKSMLALTDADLKRYVPSVFATHPAADVSSRYSFVSSKDMLNALREHGFVPTHARSYARRDADRLAFTKHMVRFRKAGDNLKKLMVGDVVPQIILVNSHDRSSRFELFGGLFRLICANGLMVSETAAVKPIIVRHIEGSTAGLIEAANKLISHQRDVFEHVNIMRDTKLTEKQAGQFAVQALELRPQRAGLLNPQDLLAARRPEDAVQDVWHIYNRVQENMMRGGQTAITANNRAVITRGVDSVAADMHINVGLWRLAMETVEAARASSAATVRRQRAAKTAAA